MNNTEETTALERIKQICERYRYSILGLEKVIGKSPGYIGYHCERKFKGQPLPTEMKLDLADVLCQVFSELNPEWVRFGRGAMTVSPEQAAANVAMRFNAIAEQAAHFDNAAADVLFGEKRRKEAAEQLLAGRQSMEMRVERLEQQVSKLQDMVLELTRQLLSRNA